MAKVKDVVSKATADLGRSLKEIKDGGEEDLGKIAGAFDEIAATADRVAEALVAAEGALTGREPSGDKQKAEERKAR